jgi:trimeric autotransporter adhesin
MKKVLIALILFPLLSQGQIISTIGGTHVAGYTGNGGPATDAKIYHPNQITLDAAGNIYIAETDNNVVRMINTAGVISLVAGNNTAGFSGDGGPATAAQLDAPIAVRFDNAGNMYIPTVDDNRIRKVDAAGIITTVAGNGTAGATGDGGMADTATFDGPFCIAFDASGDMFIADLYNNKIRKIDMTTGIVSTVAGTGIGGYSGNGGPATVANLDGPIDLVFDRAGNMLVAEINNSIIRKIAPDGTISTVTGNGIAGYSGDGGPASAAKLKYPYALCLDTADNIYISDNANAVIRKITAATGIIETVVGSGSPGYLGDGGPATAARISNVGGVATDPAGNIYIAGFGNNVVRKVTMGTTSTKDLKKDAMSVMVSPNPASTIISLSSGTRMTSVQVIDMAGRIVEDYSPNTFSMQLDISQLPPQVYLLRINNNVTKRIIKK